MEYLQPPFERSKRHVDAPGEKWIFASSLLVSKG